MSRKQKRPQEINKASIDATLAKHPKKNAAVEEEEDVKLESKEAKPEVAGKFSLCAQLRDPSWCKALYKEMQEPYFQELEAKLAESYKGDSEVCPPLHLIFNTFNLTSLDKVKVVIIGQDPYHNNQAMGLAFSVPKDSKIPCSLRNIYKELENDIPGFCSPDHGCLKHWAMQGVFLLNATLTVAQHKPNSHKNLGWQKFTDRVIQIISDHCERVVYLLWGNFAHKKGKLVDEQKHVVLKSAHPSSLSFGKFFNCKCFSQANSELEKSGLTPIDWRLPSSTL